MKLNRLILRVYSQINGKHFNYKASSFKKLFRLTLLLVFVDMFFLCFYSLNPNYLDKSVRIKIVVNYPEFDFTTKSGYKDKIFSILRNKKNHYGRVYAESSSTRLNFFLQGYGNCANQASGLGILLNQYGYNYSIIHLLNTNNYFSGVGHSVLYTKLDDTFILFDPYGGSTIQNKDKFANFQDLLSAITTSKIKLETSVFNINNIVATSNFFQKPKLDSHFIGVVIEKEIDKYHSFVNLIGAENHLQSSLNQKAIRGGALMLNLLPCIYVSKNFLKKSNFNFHKFYFFKLLSLVFISLNWIIIVSFLFLVYHSIKQTITNQK